jgi:hypothetical protein
VEEIASGAISSFPLPNGIAAGCNRRSAGGDGGGGFSIVSEYSFVVHSIMFF